METVVPRFLEERLTKDYGENLKNEIIEGLKEKKAVTLRVNNLKANMGHIKSCLDSEGIVYRECDFYESALIIENANEERIRALEIYKNGKIYLQSLSSMLPPIILEPKENENILDMTSAPGGKTTQMASISENNAMITACEKNKIRYEKLKYNVEKQGARVNLLRQDSRELDEYFSFDKVLLDSPCSGSGTDNVFSDKFSEELISRSTLVQEKLLEKALKIVKPCGEVVYSTCSVLKEENEEILRRILKKFNAEIIKIEEPKRDRTFVCYSRAVRFALSQVHIMKAFLFLKLED